MERLNSKLIKLGIIGYSGGNGHPYSWSAIFNGYNKQELSKSDYPNILEYLELENFPKAKLKNTIVTHIWTQSKKRSISIAKSCYIDNICYKPEEMIGHVDAILLARDDSKNHLKNAKIFLQNGIPVYIDKPFATNTRIAEKLITLQKYDYQIYTCSALRFAKELLFSKSEIKSLGKIISIHASSPKSWNKYAIHLIEPLSLLPGIDIFSFNNPVLKKRGNTVSLLLHLQNNIKLNIQTLGDVKSDIKITIKGENKTITKKFNNPFDAFKKSLFYFIKQIQIKRNLISRQQTMNIINIIELAS